MIRPEDRPHDRHRLLEQRLRFFEPALVHHRNREVVELLRVGRMRFAKGLDAFKGLYQHMFQHYCQAMPQVAWLNFEQDLGLANFRRTKLSYKPAALLSKVWNGDTYVTERTVDTVVSRLRRKIERDAQDPSLILTAWGVGYKFADVP